MRKTLFIFFLILSINTFALANSQLPKCQETVPSKFNNCIGEITNKNGNKYSGEFKNGYPNGHGTLIYSNGNSYVGEFKDEKLNGKGTFAWANGEIGRAHV